MAETSKPTPGQSRARKPVGTVKIWSECGATVPIPDTYGSIKFLYGQERICKNDPESIIRAEALLYESCEKIVDKRLRSIRKLFDEIIEGNEPKKKTTTTSAQERAKKRMKK